MFTIIQEFTEKYRGFRGSLFSIHPLSGCERLQHEPGEQGLLARIILADLSLHAADWVGSTASPRYFDGAAGELAWFGDTSGGTGRSGKVGR